MLESMSFKQYQEWLLFFKIRQDKYSGKSKQDSASHLKTKEEQNRLNSDIISHMMKYQKRRDNKR